MSEEKYTPLPWHVNHDRPDDPISQLSISNGDARIIANVVTKDSTHGLAGGLAHAALIVRSVNALPSLVKALEMTRQMIRGEMIESAVIDTQTMQSLGDAIDAALSYRNAKP